MTATSARWRAASTLLCVSLACALVGGDAWADKPVRRKPSRGHYQPPAPWAAACAAHMKAAQDALIREAPSFREGSVYATGGFVPNPGYEDTEARAGSIAGFDMQLPIDKLYVHVLELRDDGGSWAPVAPQPDVWATRTQADKSGPLSERQTNVDAVKRNARRIAVVRAIHWGAPRGYLQRYLDAFKAASDRCLELP